MSLIWLALIVKSHMLSSHRPEILPHESQAMQDVHKLACCIHASFWFCAEHNATRDDGMCLVSMQEVHTEDWLRL